MTDPIGINLLPASNEWVYDTLPHRATHLGASAAQVQNCYAGAPGQKTDYSLSIDQLQAAYPGCKTVSLVVAWFGNSIDVTQCRIYPSTTFIGGSSEVLSDGSWSLAPWRCSGLTQASPGLIPLSSSGGSFVYGGTPSDPSVVRCIRDLKARGFRVTFYPFILMDCASFPWRGRIGFAGADISGAAHDAVAAWLGTAASSQFSPDATNLTVGYSGSATDWTFRRMILHYANLCTIAGGVDLFLIGSELRGLETIRGPGWTKAGMTQSDGTATWDYPFVDGMVQLAADVRAVFDGAGLARDARGLHNLIAYSADWSDWMGYQHPGANGQWPHLDQLYASPAIDLVSFDNYLPLSDWTTTGGLDAAYWNAAAPTTWPPSSSAMNGLGLSGPPLLASKLYLKANIEGGEKYNWFYADSNNYGRGWDPNGSAQQVSRPEGDRLTQTRTPFQPGQQILANKMLRWWWNNPHRAVYDSGDGQGSVPRGPVTKWAAQSKSITFAEYGFPTCDRCTNQPNVFFDPKSSESFTPFWSAWDSSDGAVYRPRRDDTLAGLARDAIVEYWTSDGFNATSAAGVKMIEPSFMAAWNWDARPFPVFPQSNLWGDVGNWRAGTWIGGKGPMVPPAPPDAAPSTTTGPIFPALLGVGWSVHYQPVFTTGTALHVSGRESRAGRNAAPLWEITMSFDILTDSVRTDVQTIAGFYASVAGQAAPFAFVVPAELGLGSSIACRFADDQLDVEAFHAASLLDPVRHVVDGEELMAPPVLPALAGQGWSVHKRPTFSTRVASHVSGREVRTSLFAQTLYEFEVTYDALVSANTPALAGAGASSLQALLGFYLVCQGQLGTFLYVDPTDSVATNQAVGTGDGATTSFPLQRTLGGFSEPVSWVTAIGSVFVNGIAQSGWSLATPNRLVMASAPANGATIAASFTYAFVCRFLDDQQDFENVMAGLWQLQSLTFRSVRTS